MSTYKRLSTKALIDVLRFKAENIKERLEPEFFNEVADRLEKQVEKEAIKGTPVGVADKVMYPYKCPMCDRITSFKTIEMNGLYKYCEYCGQKVRIGGIE